MSEAALNHRNARKLLLVLALAVLASALYMGFGLNRGWGYSDDGTLGQTAERTMHGEMPHRDFHDVYTGGLAYLNALVFRLFGRNLLYLRLLLFVVYLIWVGAVFALATEFTSPWLAGVITLVAVVWSVPNYTTPMPSWYNLFLATFGTLALAKYIRRPSLYLLILAGLAGGFSFLIKSVALYYLAGALLFFVYREQSLSANLVTQRSRTPLYTAFLVSCVTVLVLALFKLVAGLGESAKYLHFVFPGFAVAILLVARELTASTVPSSHRFRSLFLMAGPFLLAFLVPVVVFFAFYAYHHALSALLAGLFIAPFRRILTAHLDPVPFLFEYPAVIAALLVVECAKLRGLQRHVLSVFLVIVAALVLFTTRRLDLSYLIALQSAAGAIPILVAATVIVLFPRNSDPSSGSERSQFLALLLTMTALFSLIQFPYSSIGYFYYVAPFAVLLAANLLSRFASPPRLVLTAAAAFYLLFAVFVVHRHYIGTFYTPPPNDTRLPFPRAGGIRGTSESVAEYVDLIPFVQNLAAGGQLLAAPDCPEVYFLAGLNNPTPILFDSLEEPAKYERETAARLDRADFIKVVVIRDLPGDAPVPLGILRALVPPRFPNSRKIARFTVYWRP